MVIKVVHVPATAVTVSSMSSVSSMSIPPAMVTLVVAGVTTEACSRVSYYITSHHIVIHYYTLHRITLQHTIS